VEPAGGRARQVQQVGLEKEVIVVDDASTDGTRELLQQIADGIASGSESTVLPKTTRSSRTCRTSSRI